MEITGKVAVVTGGASGVGEALCLGLAERGAAAHMACSGVRFVVPREPMMCSAR